MPSKVPALPPTYDIKDPDVRAFAEALVNAWELRNGNIGANDDERFITKKEIDALTRNAVVTVLGGGGVGSIGGGTLTQDPLNPGGGGNGSGGGIDAIIDNLSRAIMDTALFRKLGEQIKLIDVPTSAQAGIEEEVAKRIEKTSVLASAIKTIWASMGGTGANDISALIQDGALASVTPAAAEATKWTQVQSAVTDPNTGQVASTAILQETRTYANAVDGTLDSMWTVRAQLQSGGTTVTGTGSSGSAGSKTLVLTASNASIVAGMRVVGPGIAPGTTVASVSGATITLSYALVENAATSSTSVTATAATATATVNATNTTTLVLTASNANVVAGMKVTGTGIPAGTTVTSVNGVNIFLSAPLTAAASGTYTFARTYEFSNAKLLLGGFGLAASNGAGTSGAPSIDFGVRADKFFIAGTADTPDLSTQLTTTDVPFVVVTATTTVNGITYAPGVYMKTAMIADLSVGRLKIFNPVIGTASGTPGATGNTGDITVTIPETGRNPIPIIAWDTPPGPYCSIYITYVAPGVFKFRAWALDASFNPITTGTFNFLYTYL